MSDPHPPRLPLTAADTDVVLAAMCTFRASRLEPYGYAEPTTPFLDLLAAAGVQMTEHYAQAAWTRPSMGTIYTGRWPRALRLDRPAPVATMTTVLSKQHTTLAMVFDQRDRAVIGAVANPNAGALFGFARGFDAFHTPVASFRRRRPAGRDLVEWALDQVRSIPSDQRLFLRFVLIDTHGPHRPHPLHYEQYFAHQRPLDRAYNSAMRGVDAWLSLLFVELKKLRPNLLFVVTGDHGEGLRDPEHHGLAHGGHLYRSTTQTPLIVHHPALPRGHRVDALSMNIDIHPTILDLLGLVPTHPVDGQSLAPLIRAETRHGPHQYVFSETYFGSLNKVMVTDGHHHLIRNRNTAWLAPAKADRLFADNDRDATKDLAADLPAELARLQATLAVWESQMSELRRRYKETDRREVEELDAATRDQLRELGYLD